MNDFQILALMSSYFGAVLICCYVGSSFFLNDPNGWMISAGIFCFLSAPMLVIIDSARKGRF